MKKTGVMFLAVMLSSCWSGGRLDLFEQRNQWIEELQSQSVDWFEHGSKVVKSEYITETNYKTNEVLTAHKGHTVVDTKTYRKDYSTQEYLKANKDGVLNSGTVPVTIRKNEKKKLIGSTMMGSEECYLVRTDLDDYVMIVRDNGTFYPKIGRIKNDKLIIMNETFIPYPEDLRFEPIVTTSSTQTRPVKGFDVKYEGLKLDRLLFIYFDYSDSAGDAGNFENLSYAPTESGLIKVKGIKIKVLHADDQRLDYMIVE